MNENKSNDATTLQLPPFYCVLDTAEVARKLPSQEVEQQMLLLETNNKGHMTKISQTPTSSQYFERQLMQLTSVRVCLTSAP